jgi:hypothetical protein
MGPVLKVDTQMEHHQCQKDQLQKAKAEKGDHTSNYKSTIIVQLIVFYFYILYVPLIRQQIQISVDQPYAGPAASCCGINGTHSISLY